MKNSYIKMNDSIHHLSLGNFFRIIKENANIKNAALQIDLFCTIFNIDSINDTTVNNYCTGYRAINDSYKQIYINLRKKYAADNSILQDIIINLLSIVTGSLVKTTTPITTINNSNILHKTCIALYTLSKNDMSVPKEVQDSLRNYISTNNLYNFICEVLFFIIIDKIQPIYEKDEITDTIEQIIENTALSIHDIKQILNFSLIDGIWSIRGLRELAKEENPVACFQLGSLEFNGEITGSPRYAVAYKYLEIAARKDHPSANWMLGMIHINTFVNLSPDYQLAWNYFKKSEALGCVAAINSIGLCYLKGTTPGMKIDIKKAIEYFKKAAEKNYVFAYNNLGKIYENQENYKLALETFIKSANQGESWAANKVGEYYRLGIGSPKNLEKSFEYYQISSVATDGEITPWCYYNLAHYFYNFGCIELGIEPDLEKTKKLYALAAKRGIKEAEKELEKLK